jgi:DNA-binding transcriptional ArsR family regulator
MDLPENIAIFAVVVEMESLNKAAQALNISQPALSRKIMRLEEELGVELFRRKGKRSSGMRTVNCSGHWRNSTRRSNRQASSSAPV